ncbi:uncharacterized protein BJ212DRAFT_850725 [Suillus subaureus]|uniref:Uncharacterized protein n=1 Tax=Suillus subaureus TaxID=48587 RepID=A0A9P7DX96_9AGAM|nr:uncharacterized protein BJ212DRAFT_850725 [Suillus subaureus]KAG1805683.1 hypothetical protein BJ212DRAFT_850725 [Suillus subaureus]
MFFCINLIFQLPTCILHSTRNITEPALSNNRGLVLPSLHGQRLGYVFLLKGPCMASTARMTCVSIR